MKKIFFLLALILAASHCFAQTVLLNDDFSRKNDSWNLTLYQPFSAVEYTADKGLVMMRNPKQQPIKGKFFDTAFWVKSAPLKLPAGAPDFELAVCTESTRGKIFCIGHKDSYHNRIVWYDKDVKRLTGRETYYTPRFRAGKPIWTTFRGKIPEKACYAEVQFGMDSPDLKQGENIMLRAVSFVTGTQKQLKALPFRCSPPLIPTLKSVSPAADASAPAAFELSNPDTVDWKATRILLDGKDVTDKITRENGIFILKPEKEFAKGIHIFTLDLTDLSGNNEKQTLVFYIGERNRKNVMTLRDDGMALMDGKPFFTLGLACLVKQGRNGNNYDRAFAEAAKAGINFARHWSSYNMEWPDAKEYLAAAKKHGVYLSMSPTKVPNDTDISRIAAGTAKQINAEQVIAWDVGDDTSAYVTPDAMASKYQAIKAIDPTRIITQADIVGTKYRSSYRDFVKMSDSFQPEIYPIGNTSGRETPEMTAKMVPDVIRDMKLVNRDISLSGGSKRSIWPLIQYFHYKPGPHWNRMPTKAELRAMSYLAVIHGAHGVIWYRYAGYPGTPNAKRGYSEEEWETLTSVIHEFRSLYDVLCERTGKQTQKTELLSGPAKDGLGFDSANTLLKECKGKKYLFVCNSAMSDVKMKFTVPGIQTARELFEKRTLSVKDGTFDDTFAPYGVHVYEMN